MDDSQKPDFAIAIGALLETFGSEATKPLLLGYWLGLQDLTLEQVQVAVARAARESERLPKPVELRKLAGMHMDGQDRAVGAWHDVQRALGLGPYKTVDFTDKLVNAVIRNLGGWPSFVARFRDSDSEKWLRLEFIRTYSSFANTGVNGEAVAPLPGLAEVSVRAGMLMPPIPVVITADAVRMRLPVQRAEPIAIALKRA